MAEFCLECYNKLHKSDLRKSEVKLSPDLCEGCGKIKKTIVYIKRNR
jgi:NAD-dependent SIR2 family protein deacetylase